MAKWSGSVGLPRRRVGRHIGFDRSAGLTRALHSRMLGGGLAVVGATTSRRFVKNDKSVMSLEWVVLEDQNADTDDDLFGRLIAQDAAAL